MAAKAAKAAKRGGAPAGDVRPVTAPSLAEMKRRGQRITALTAYDATLARLFDRAGIDILLVGDSLGMVIQGHASTLPVTLEHVIYHTQHVARVVKRAHLVSDMPFMSYQVSLEDGIRNAGRLIQEGGAAAVKIEGGERNVELVNRLAAIGIPVMGHLGLTPQSVHAMGGYKVQGRQPAAAQQLVDEAKAIAAAGAYAIVLEGVPRELAREITASVTIPTIGIGAGVDCDGQILVCYDFLGMDPAFTPRFVKPYAQLGTAITSATEQFIAEVRAARFPDLAHSFTRDEASPSSRRTANKGP